eukprot:gene13256-biopygen6105
MEAARSGERDAGSDAAGGARGFHTGFSQKRAIHGVTPVPSCSPVTSHCSSLPFPRHLTLPPLPPYHSGDAAGAAPPGSWSLRAVADDGRSGRQSERARGVFQFPLTLHMRPAQVSERRPSQSGVAVGCLGDASLMHSKGWYIPAAELLSQG